MEHISLSAGRIYAGFVENIWAVTHYILGGQYEQ
jgi:hypothetical protein